LRVKQKERETVMCGKPIPINIFGKRDGTYLAGKLFASKGGLSPDRVICLLVFYDMVYLVNFAIKTKEVLR
jgi:hypothetical protein